MSKTLSEKERFQEVLNTLNETQRASVLSDAENLQILAGPGSGKTRVLTCRVAYFVIEKGTHPGHIIVVTFTNKAANEMKSRLNYLIGEKRTDLLLIGTFHTICSRILRRHGNLVNLDPNYTIADTQTSQDIITRLRDHKAVNIGHFTRVQMKAGAIWGIISKAKSKGETATMYAARYGSDFKTRDIAILYTLYEEELEKLNLVDFDNLLIKACELFMKKSDVLFNIKAILVDEYQDTNVVQYELIKLMMKQTNDKTVTIVGDPDQSIFGWRSAEPKNFTKMQNDYIGTSAITMEQNYRSTGTILKAALHVITQDKTRIDKALYTNNPDGIPISLVSTYNEESQAEWVAKEISKVMKYSKNLIEYKDIAVLMRMNFISQQFEKVFRKHKIPFSIVGGDRFFDRVEIKDILSYLRFAYNPKDYLSFGRIINVPRRGIGEVNLNKIITANAKEDIDMLETIKKIGAGTSSVSFTPQIRSKLKELSVIVDEASEMIKNKEDVSDIIHFIVTAIKYEDYLKEHYFADHVARWGNIGELISVAKKQPTIAEEEDFQIDGVTNVNEENIITTLGIKREPDDIEEINMADITVIEAEEDHVEPLEVSDEGIISNDPIADFLEYCSLCSNQKELEEAEGGKVTIATLHSSKGLEWPCVFIATCNEGVIPLGRAEDMEEEGRLLYVGMTRSKFLLYCISPEERNSWGNYSVETPSRFLKGMDRSLYKRYAPEWDNETRRMLATTIGKTPPPDDDTLVTKRPKTKISSHSSSQSSFSSSQSSFYSSQPNSQNSDIAIQFGGFTSASRIYHNGFAAPPPKKARKETSVNSSNLHVDSPARKSSNVPIVRTVYSPKTSKKVTTKITATKTTSAMNHVSSTTKSEPTVKSETVSKSLPTRVKTESAFTVMKTEK